MLPELFQVQLDQFLQEPSSVAKLKQQWDRLNTHYKNAKGAYTQSTGDHLAYILARMPATFAASCAVIQEALNRSLNLPGTILDLGAGPGTLAWACSSFPLLKDIPVTQVEQDETYKLFLQKVCPPNSSKMIYASWDQLPTASYDWVTAAFLLCEIKPSMKELFIQKAWAASRSLLILIQPGTPTGYQELMMARTLLIKQGAHILAPCLHEKACPMQGENWCHFKARFQRTPTQMLLKSATRGFEDETYSYVIASRFGGGIAEGGMSRVIASPLKRSGHVRLDLCLDDGKLCKMTFSKSQKDVYQRARDTDWGDCLTIGAMKDEL